MPFLVRLARFALLVFTLTFIHGGFVLPIIAKVVTGIKFKDLFRALSLQPMAMAFATSSSSATLPLSMQNSRRRELNISQSTSVWCYRLALS